MLRSLTIWQWRKWKIYMTLAPFTEERADIRAASICEWLVNMWRNTDKHPQHIPLENFLLKFGDALDPKTIEARISKPQTAEEIERHISDWVKGSNRVFEESRRGS